MSETNTFAHGILYGDDDGVTFYGPSTADRNRTPSREQEDSSADFTLSLRAMRAFC